MLILKFRGWNRFLRRIFIEHISLEIAEILVLINFFGIMDAGELDCLEIVQQLHDLNQFPSQPHMTIRAIWEMLKRDWAVTITHVY